MQNGHTVNGITRDAVQGSAPCTARPSWINPTPAFSCADPYPVVGVAPSTSSAGRWVVRSSDVRMDFFFSRQQANAFAAQHNANYRR